MEHVLTHGRILLLFVLGVPRVGAPMFDICLSRKRSCDDNILRAATYFSLTPSPSRAGQLSKDDGGSPGKDRERQ